MDNPPVLPKKKGLSGLAWLGIGCGGVVVIFAVIGILGAVLFGSKFKDIAKDAATNPTRMAANIAISASVGQLEMAEQDDVNKRYTVRQKLNGKLITFYWNPKKNAPDTVEGDFSAIPADASTPVEPAPK